VRCRAPHRAGTSHLRGTPLLLARYTPKPWGHCLGTVDHLERGETSCPTGGRPKAPKNRGELGNPPPSELLQSIEDSRLEPLQEHATHTFNLPVHAGVRHGGQVDADVITIIEFEEFLPYELCTIIRDDGVRDSKVVDDVGEKFHGLLRPDRCDRASLNPLHELVNGDTKMRVAPGCFL
jgi:hypothetical protein